jgi:hypothetical protein
MTPFYIRLAPTMNHHLGPGIVCECGSVLAKTEYAVESHVKHGKQHKESTTEQKRVIIKNIFDQYLPRSARRVDRANRLYKASK